jgi:hypothetical protein
VRKKRLPPNVKPNPINTLGKTGQDFAGQITAKLEDKLKQPDKCDAILVIDDLDCACDTLRKQLFNEAINQAGNGEFKEVKRIIGFAAPELEAWIIADWDNTIAKHIDFRQNHRAMQHWLSSKHISFQSPEKFSFYDEKKKSCHEKLSELLIESSEQIIEQERYSKSKHTPLLLYDSLKPQIVAEKCPLFREFFMQLQNLTSESLT